MPPPCQQSSHQRHRLLPPRHEGRCVLKSRPIRHRRLPSVRHFTAGVCASASTLRRLGDSAVEPMPFFLGSKSQFSWTAAFGTDVAITGRSRKPTPSGGSRRLLGTLSGTVEMTRRLPEQGGSWCEYGSTTIPRSPPRASPYWSGIAIADSDVSRVHYPSNLSAAFASSATVTRSAAAIPRTVAQVGLPSPRSIIESMFSVIPASAATVLRLASRL